MSGAVRFSASIAVRGAALACALASAGSAFSQPQPNLGTEAQRQAGKVLYDKFCSACHGTDGDGKGLAAPYLNPGPRNLASGRYKIRTTPSGALPTDRDLENILRKGMPYTSMSGWPRFSGQELRNIVYHVKSFTPQFGDPDFLAEGMRFPEAPPLTRETVAAGRKVYEDFGCIRCHGDSGRGDGKSSPTLVDDWGVYIWASDLTAKWVFRGGATRADLFRTLSTGLNGVPMPSYSEPLNDEQRWNLVDYMYSLSHAEEAPYSELLIVKPVNGEIDPGGSLESFDAAPEAMFPVVGQIMQPGRNFAPLLSNIRVRAVYSSTEIAFLLQWTDLLTDTAGTNALNFEVPRFDPEQESVSPYVSEERAEGVWEFDEEFWGDELAPEDDDDFWGEEEEGDEPPVPVSEFSDAVALQLPMEPPTGIRKPYFLLGDRENDVDLWFLDLASGEAQQLTARGSGRISLVEGTDVTSTASYEGGQWSVIFKRPLSSWEGIGFPEGQFLPVGFSVWDGFNGERGNKRGLTQWCTLYVEPRRRVSALGPMARAGLGTLGVELLLVFWLRWRERRKRVGRA